jgi:hypothetical protein
MADSTNQQGTQGSCFCSTWEPLPSAETPVTLLRDIKTMKQIKAKTVEPLPGSGYFTPLCLSFFSVKWD